MNIGEIKSRLDPSDIYSLLYWQKIMNIKFEEFEIEEELPNEEFLDLYDFIMHKIAWKYINKEEL